MARPVRFDIPHRLGRAEARRRMDAGLGDLDRAMPFASRIGKAWQGDRLVIEVTALGQVTTANLDVESATIMCASNWRCPAFSACSARRSPASSASARPSF